MKPHHSTAQLVDLLGQERGLSIEDRTAAESFLRRTNYYRFTGYARHFQVNPRAGDNQFRAGVSFNQICSLMQADDRLRHRLFIVLTEIELAVRTRFAHVSGRQYKDQGFYLDSRNYLSDTVDVTERIRSIRLSLEESKSPMVQHYISRGGVESIPIWVAVEVLSFGRVSWMLGSLSDDAVRNDVADHFSYARPTFPRVIHSLATLRNACAHHSQLWNRYLVAQCPLPLNKRERPRDVQSHAQSLFPAILAMDRLTHSRTSRSQLAAIRRCVLRADEHGEGVRNPEGTR